MYSHRIRDSLESAGIHLIPETYPENVVPESATSFVFNEGGGKRTSVSYRGNSRDILTPDMITPELVQKSNIVFVQGSLWDKWGDPVPDKLLSLRYASDPTEAKELWLTLPTNAQFPEHMPPERYQYLVHSADVVMSNDEELMRVYKTDDFDAAAKALQEALSHRDEILAHDHRAPHIKPPVAFITRGEKGAVVITPEHITAIAAPDVSKHKKLYTIGAGDTSYAGFLAGRIAGLSPEKSATFGMQLAGAKLGFEGARMPDPRETLQKFSAVGKALLKEIDKRLTLMMHVNGAPVFASQYGC